MPVLFGILQLDRGEPHGYANLLGLLQAWLQDAGGFGALGLIVYLIYALTIPTDKSQSEKLRVPVSTWMVAMAALSIICYAGLLALIIRGYGAVPATPLPPPGTPIKVDPPRLHLQPQPVVLTVAGFFALLGIGQPFARDMLKIRFRRIWALAKLSFKEAIRNRLYLVGLLILLPFLSRNIWMADTRPADEFRNLTSVIALVTMLLILISSAVLSAFSLPNDIKNQTIHTVVTKPVERFEIVLGRFMGYVGIFTIALVSTALVSLLFINTARISESGADQAAKAREPVRGKLEFKSRKVDFEGTNVGKEFDYRRFIAGHPISPQRAVWNFSTFPSSILNPENDAVPIEFTFDVYKLTKGEENRGVRVSFRVVTHNCPQIPPTKDQAGEWQWADNTIDPADKKTPKQHFDDDLKKYQSEGLLPEGARPGDPAWKAANELAEKYGYYEKVGVEVYDYAVMGINIPAGIFRNALKGKPEKDAKGNERPLFSIYVKCESPGQLLGMAEPDLYILVGTQPFSVNYLKGMLGLWCLMCIVIAIAVTCTTYFAGVLSLLLTAVIYLPGHFTDHLNDIAANRSIGGGPFESMSRVLKAEQPTAPSSDTVGVKVFQFFDVGAAWIARRVQNVIPDVESFTWESFVSEGYNVNGEYLVVNLIVLFGYLLPWAVLSYYLMKSREIAN